MAWSEEQKEARRSRSKKARGSKAKYSTEAPKQENRCYDYRSERGLSINSQKLYTEDETEFLKAMDIYRAYGRLPGQKKGIGPRPFPALTEIMRVFQAQGYQRQKDFACDSGALCYDI